MNDKTHYRKAFNSPYLASADIVDATTLTIKCVRLEGDQTKKSKDVFNTAYFVETEIRQGEPLKPMILNAGNSKTLKELTKSHFIDDWNNIPVTIYVDHSVRFGRDTVDGLRISSLAPTIQKPELTQAEADKWARAVAVFKSEGNLNRVLARVTITPENIELIKQQAA